MKKLEITEDLFRRHKDSFSRFDGFAQDANALEGLIVQATGSICSIATVPFTTVERQRFLALLSKHGWSAQIGQDNKLSIGGVVYTYDSYEVRIVRKQPVTA